MSNFDPIRAGLIYVFGIDVRDVQEQVSWTKPNNRTYATPDGVLEIRIQEESGRVQISRTDVAEGRSGVVFDDALEQPHPSHEAVMKVLRGQGYEYSGDQ